MPVLCVQHRLLPVTGVAARAWPRRAPALASVCLHLLAVLGVGLLILPAPPRPQSAETEIAFLQSIPGQPDVAAPSKAVLTMPPALPTAAPTTPAPPLATPSLFNVARQQAALPAAPIARALPPPRQRRLVVRDVPVTAHPGVAHTAPRQRADPAAAAPSPADHAVSAPAPPPPPVPDTAWVPAFTARVQSAVQAAAAYPMMARRARQQGRVQISFDYTLGTAADAAVLVSSQTPALDRAALKAVASAAYPPAPAALGGGRIRLVVWVDFTLSPDG